MLDIDDKDIRKLISSLDSFEKKFQGKFSRKAIHAGMKLVKKNTKSEIQKRVGGEMGHLIAGAVRVKAPKRRKKDLVARLVNLKMEGLEDRLIHETEHTSYAEGSREGENIRYSIPAAIEYGHALPYEGVLGGGSGVKSVDPTEAWQMSWINGRSRMISTIVDTYWYEVKKYRGIIL